MARLLLPTLVTGTGLLLAAGLTATRFTRPFEGASSDNELYNLIADALHDPHLKAGPVPGASTLPINAIAAESLQPTPSPSPPVEEVDARLQPQRWAEIAAQTDSGALRDWLGDWVVATSAPAGDSLHLNLRRLSFRSGCPLISRLSAVLLQVHGESRIVRVEATCPGTPGR